MISINRSTNSCGITEINGISGLTPLKILSDVYRRMRGTGRTWSYGAGYITFSDVVSKKTIVELKDYMIENGFNNVTYLKEVINPNSGNKIGFIVWVMDKKFFKTWYEKVEDQLLPPIKVGQEYRITGGIGMHGIKKGTVVKVKSICYSREGFYPDSDTHIYPVNLSDCELIK